MRRDERVKGLRVAALMCVVAGLAASVSGGQTPPPPPSEAPVGGPLGGPSVDDVNLPGRGRTFGEGMDQDRKNAGRVNPRQIMRAVESLEDENTPEDLRPSEEQREQVRSIMQEFRAAVASFRAEHEEEIRELRSKADVGERAGPPRTGDDKQMRGQGPNAGEPPADSPRRKGPRGERGPRPEPTAAQQEARERLKQLMSQGPDVKQYQARVWEALRPEQRELLNARMEDMQREEGARRLEGMGRGEREGDGMMQGERKGKGPKLERGPEGARGGERQKRLHEALADPAKREQALERIKERIEKMPPEQREQALRRLGKILDEMGAGASGEKPAPGSETDSKPQD